MTHPRFIQIHSLHTYTGVLLNRDDSGAAKRLPVGGEIRTRVSSQCLKRHWRIDGGPGLGLTELGEDSKRTRLADTYVGAALDKEVPGLAPEFRAAILEALMRMIYGPKGGTDIKKRQAVLLGNTELDYIGGLAVKFGREATDLKELKATLDAFGKETKGNWKAMVQQVAVPGGIPAALFGRMVTADPASNTDAAIHVAHAFTVHTQESEGDALTVVDDLVAKGDSGAGGMFDTEINSGTFYGYVVVDVTQLLENVGGDEDMAEAIVDRLVRLIATVSPGAKLGSTAPYGYVETMLVEIGDEQPRSLASAFHVPVPLRQNRSAAEIATDRLAARITSMDKVFGTKPERHFISVEAESALTTGRCDTLAELARTAASAVRGGSALKAA